MAYSSITKKTTTILTNLLLAFLLSPATLAAAEEKAQGPTIDQLKEENARLQHIVERLKKHHNDIKLQLAKVANKELEEHQRVMSLQLANNIMAQMHADIQKANKNLASSIINIRRKAVTQTKGINEMYLENRNLKEQITKSKGFLQVLEALLTPQGQLGPKLDLSVVQEEKGENLPDIIKRLQSKFRELEEAWGREKEKLVIEKEKLVIEKEALQYEILKTTQQEAKCELESRNTQAELDAELSTGRSRAQTLKITNGELQAKEKTIQTQKTQIGDLKKQIKDLTDHSEIVKGELIATTEEWETRDKVLEKEKAAWDKQRPALEKERNELKTENTELKNQQQKYKTKTEQLMNKNTNLTTTNKNLVLANGLLKQELLDTKQNLESLQTAINNLDEMNPQQGATQSEEEIKKLRRQVTHCKDSLEKLLSIHSSENDHSGSVNFSQPNTFDEDEKQPQQLFSLQRTKTFDPSMQMTGRRNSSESGSGSFANDVQPEDDTYQTIVDRLYALNEKLEESLPNKNRDSNENTTALNLDEHKESTNTSLMNKSRDSQEFQPTTSHQRNESSSTVLYHDIDESNDNDIQFVAIGVDQHFGNYTLHNQNEEREDREDDVNKPYPEEEASQLLKTLESSIDQLLQMKQVPTTQQQQVENLQSELKNKEQAATACNKKQKENTAKLNNLQQELETTKNTLKEKEKTITTLNQRLKDEKANPATTNPTSLLQEWETILLAGAALTIATLLVLLFTKKGPTQSETTTYYLQPPAASEPTVYIYYHETLAVG